MRRPLPASQDEAKFAIEIHTCEYILREVFLAIVPGRRNRALLMTLYRAEIDRNGCIAVGWGCMTGFCEAISLRDV
jgi:hypothetical protein